MFQMKNDELYLIALKEKCEQSFKFFVRYFFKRQYGKEFIWSWHHQQISDVLMDIFEGRKTHVLINVPPRYTKTELIIKMFSAWTFAKNPRCCSLHLSYSSELALGNSLKIIETIRLPEYQALWPDAFIPRDKSSKKQWETSVGGQ